MSTALNAIHIFLQPYADAYPPSNLSTALPDQYSGSAHVDYGLTNPTLRAFVNDWVKKYRPSLSYEDWGAVLDALYRGRSLDERVLAGMILSRFPTFRHALALLTLDDWLDQLVGWMEVDGTCQSVFTPEEMLLRWAEWQPFLTRLVDDVNINKRRAGLVLLVRPVRESTDARIVDLTLAQIDTLKSERDKLIAKAVSWVLREGVKLHHARIDEYLDANAQSLAPFVVREVQTKLTTGKKISR